MSKINTESLVSYSLLAFCLSFIGLPIYIYLPSYYADNFNISLKVMAFILLATRLFDAISDPIFGLISDKIPTLKKKIICYLSPFLGLAFLLLFQPANNASIQFWLIAFLLITYSLFSVIYINYQSYAVSLSHDYHLKTTIISYRETSFILGIIFAAASPAILFKYVSETDSFWYIGVVYLFLITVFAVIFYFKAPDQKANQKTAPEKGSLTTMLTIPSLRKYFTIFFFNSISSAIPAVLIIFFVDNIINAKSLVGLFLILYFVGLLLGVIVWTKISKIINSKTKTWLISIIATVAVFAWCYFLKEGDVMLYGCICILSGIGFGGDFALSYSILTDIIQKNNLETKQSSIFGIVNFILKFSLTLSSAILIYYIGDLEKDVQGQKQFISFAYALLPIFFRTISAFALFRDIKLTKM